MAKGKETPRQKMIGMMYLVLTAMLALNVAKEVLNAFILVDIGLVTTTENFDAKNASVYSDLARKYALNPEKVGDWKDKAEEVKRRSDEIYDFMHECKIAILSEKGKDVVREDGTFDWDKAAKENMDIPAQIMMVEGKGAELKSRIDELREYMLSLIDDKEKYNATVGAIEGILTTELPDVELEKRGRKVIPTWEYTYFEQMPLASVIALLSKMQADVRNAELEMVNYLLGQVEAGDIPVNAVREVVMADRSVVFPGEEYKARVFLAAYDSTNIPTVVLNNGTQLETESGMGIYTASSDQLGVKTWGGTIKLEYENQVREFPFESSYEVTQPSATISATAMNVFFRGIDNPVEISVGTVPESAVRASINGPHSIRRIRPNQYIVKPGVQGDNATVSVYAEIDGASRLMNRMNFRVKPLPTPTAKITGSRGGTANLTVGQLTALQIVEAEAEDFLFEVPYTVTSFTVGFYDASNIWNEEVSNSNKFTSAQRAIFRNMRSSQRIAIENIKSTGPDGVIRTLSPININVR